MLRHTCSIWAISLTWEWLSSLCYPVNKSLTPTYPTLSCPQPVPVKRNYPGTSWISLLHSSVFLFTQLNRRAMMSSLTHIFPSEASEQISKSKTSQWTAHFHCIVYHLSDLWRPSRDVLFWTQNTHFLNIMIKFRLGSLQSSTTINVDWCKHHTNISVQKINNMHFVSYPWFLPSYFLPSLQVLPDLTPAWKEMILHHAEPQAEIP